MCHFGDLAKILVPKFWQGILATKWHAIFNVPFWTLKKNLVPKLWQGILAAKFFLSVQNGTLAKWHLSKMAP